MQASHPQDMEGWPDYWERMIPMHYATHVVSPVLGLMDSRAESVSCVGSGRVRDDIHEKSGNAFAVESCHIKIADSDVVRSRLEIPLRRRAAVPRELRRLRLEGIVRMDAGGRPAAHSAQGQTA